MKRLCFPILALLLLGILAGCSSEAVQPQATLPPDAKGAYAPLVSSLAWGMEPQAATEALGSDWEALRSGEELWIYPTGLVIRTPVTDPLGNTVTAHLTFGMDRTGLYSIQYDYAPEQISAIRGFLQETYGHDGDGYIDHSPWEVTWQEARTMADVPWICQQVEAAGIASPALEVSQLGAVNLDVPLSGITLRLEGATENPCSVYQWSHAETALFYADYAAQAGKYPTYAEYLQARIAAWEETYGG